jgi:hypothetical protein
MRTVHYASYLVNGEDVYGTAELLNGSQHDVDMLVGGYAAVACTRDEGRN